MGRPISNPEKRRNGQLNIRLSDAERLRLESKADLLGLTLSEFIRDRGLGYRMPRLAAQRQTDAQAIVALNRLGILVNQVAHHLNAGWATAGTAAAVELLAADIRTTMRGLRRGPENSGQQPRL